MPKRTVLLSLLFVLALASPAWAGAPTMPLGQVARGMHCTGLSVVQGTTISSFDVDVVDVIVGVKGEQARILVRVSGPAIDASGIAQGFSGSPVYCTDAAGAQRVIGAISETVGEYGEKVGLVTPIEQILGAPVSPPPTAHYRPALLRSAKPAVGPLT
ncbi:MAG TPA: hypothetical protein VHE14_00605, partial [Solirubrobacteraceae bacterium]|nr:hypothetical protein [Solirubrobacteraceae bacterium]